MDLRRFLNWLGDGLKGRLGLGSAARICPESLDRPWEIEFGEGASDEDTCYCFRLTREKPWQGRVEWSPISGRQQSEKRCFDLCFFPRV